MTFGSDANAQRVLDRQNAQYGTDDPIEQGRMIVEAQRAANARRAQVDSAPDRSEWVADQNRRYEARINRASEKAISYLVSLSASRTPHVDENAIRTWAAVVDRQIVSDKIDELKAMPLAAEAAVPSISGALEQYNVPAGRYAVTGNDGQTVFVKVDRPTEGQWAGRIFVRLQVSDSEVRIGRASQHTLLAKIADAGIKASMLRYGVELGHCGHCGRTLTNEESRAAGIGPVCRGKMGW